MLYVKIYHTQYDFVQLIVTTVTAYITYYFYALYKRPRNYEFRYKKEGP